MLIQRKITFIIDSLRHLPEVRFSFLPCILTYLLHCYWNQGTFLFAFVIRLNTQVPNLNKHQLKSIGSKYKQVLI